MSDAGADGGPAPTPNRESSRDGPTGGEPVEFTATSAFVVSQPLATGSARTVRDRIAERRPDDGSGTAWLLPGDDVVTASVFLARRDGDDALVWYVEVEGEVEGDGGAWADPAATLARRTPLYDGFEGQLAGEARSYGDPEAVVHAANPARPGHRETADVALVSIDVEPGVGTWLARLVAGVVDALEGTRIGRKFESAAGEVIEDEGMWTETMFLDETGGDYEILWYMEADDMDRVVEVYETTDNRVARWSEVAFDYLVGTPLAALGDPMGASDYELLVHETNPARR